MNLSEQQKEIVNTTANKVVVIASAASGKAQPNSTIIPTPNGYKTIGELKIGDKVFNRFGKPETVIGVFPQGKKQIYKITFQDKREVLCCGEHLWSYDNSHNGFTTKTLKEMYEQGWIKKDNRGHNSYKYRIPNLTQSVEYDKKDFAVNPYTIGCFLGDGCCLESRLTLSSNDEFIVQRIATIEGFNYKKAHPDNYSWHFFELNNQQPIKTKLFFSQYSKELICYCHEKRIPKEYLLGNTEQRLELLRGLMDTDGTVGNGRNSPSYATNSYQLALDVAELCRSLGIFCTIFTNDRRDSGKNIEYTVNIAIDRTKLSTIFKLPRKVAKAKNYEGKPCRMTHKFVSIYNIEPLEEEVEMTCIQVDDSEHLYLTNDFIVTHNTAVLVERVKHLIELGEDPKYIVLITFTNAAAEELAERLGHPQGMFIGTIHSYANYLLLANGNETHDLLEEEQFDKLFNRIKHNLGCIKPVRHLLLDESQDSNETHFEFLLDMIKPLNYMIMGDHKQSIYRWNGAYPDYIINLSKQSDVTTYELNENYRNATSILNYAKNLIMVAGYDYRDSSIPMRGVSGKVVPDLKYNPDAIAKTFSQMRDGFGDWFILTRTNSQIDEVVRVLEKYKVPYDTFKRAQLDNKELNKKMKENTVKVLTIHTAKGLEANNVIVVGARFYNLEERCISYVAATRARNVLIWTRMPYGNKQSQGTVNWEK